MAVNNLVDSPFPTAASKGGTGVNNGANTLTVTANSTINQNVSTTASPTFDNVQVTTAILDTNAATILKMDAQTTSTSTWSIRNGNATSDPIFDVVGTPANINTNVRAKGTGFFAVLGTTTREGQIRLYNATNTGSVGISPNASATSYEVTMPAGQGAAGTVLQNNGSGVLSWIANGGSGAILQVLQANLNTTFSATSSSFTDITGLSVSITPQSTSSRILVICSVCGNADPAVGTDSLMLNLVRGSTSINQGAAGTGQTRVTGGSILSSSTRNLPVWSVVYIDSPATTSATTYKLQGMTPGGTAAFYINRTVTNSGNSTFPLGTSSITVIEIAS